ncbi:MAG: hypothetical protein NT010_11365 [Proteobacteria bacterium]|nr:hypothetical protein [Pseudomonadota bacterium]
MERSTINKILSSKYLYTLATENLRTEQGIKLSVGVNLLQDAVELFLLSVAEYLSADIPINTIFDKYFDLINKKIEPKELPFRSRLNSLNKLRVNSKHYGIQPAQEEVKQISVVVGEFFEEVSLSVFGNRFATFSLIDLLRDGEAKELLKQAENYFNEKNYSECLICSSKALYLEIEKDYDISKFKDKSISKGNWGLMLYGPKAPFWAKNPEYIEEKVNNHCDYIVFDHSTLEMDLIKSGVDTNTFWNVWRLTPPVFRFDKDGDWIVKYKFKCFDEDGINNRAEYVLSSAIEIILSIHQKKSQIKSPEDRLYNIDLGRPNIPVYSKASKNSSIVRNIPEGLTKLETDYRITGLDSNDIFWHVNYYKIDDAIFFSGFIHNDDIKFT